MSKQDLKLNKDYKYGFTTDIEDFKAPKGLNEQTIKFISKIKKRTKMDVRMEIKSL